MDSSRNRWECSMRSIWRENILRNSRDRERTASIEKKKPFPVATKMSLDVLTRDAQRPLHIMSVNKGESMSMAVDLQHLSCKTWKIIFRIIEDFLTEKRIFFSFRFDFFFTKRTKICFFLFVKSRGEEKPFDWLFNSLEFDEKNCQSEIFCRTEINGSRNSYGCNTTSSWWSSVIALFFGDLSNNLCEMSA